MVDHATAEFFQRHAALERGVDSLFLPGWTTADWTLLLAHSEPVHLARHAVLIERGEEARSLFLVVQGALEVNTGAQGGAMGDLVRIGPGAVLGEIAFFDGGGRSSRVWATEATDLIRLERSAVEAFIALHPVQGMALLMALGRVLAARVRRSERRRVDAF